MPSCEPGDVALSGPRTIPTNKIGCNADLRPTVAALVRTSADLGLWSRSAEDEGG